MIFDHDRMTNDKDKLREELRKLPFAEKLRILEQMRERNASIRAAAALSVKKDR